MKKQAVLLLLFLSLAFVGSILIWSPTAYAETAAFTGRVVGIADGDTLTVLADNVPHKIRLAEIDAPEKKQAFGLRAKQSLSDLCFDQQAEVSPGVTDRYGRTVARVRCKDVDTSLYQVNNGLAWAYTRYLTDPAIATAEQAARASGVGLWADADPTPPWLFRKARK
jgi:endonuclease YncB( thermonuclease family)